MDLKVNNLVKYYDKKLILDNISIDLKEIGVLALIGPSGSGKSTLLRLIAGLEQFQGGAINLNGFTVIDDKNHDLDDFRKKVGFVFQDHNLFNHLSVMKNICLVLEKVHKMNKDKAIEIVTELLTKFGLWEHRDKLPHQISGGQSQRVSIVRALAIQPEIILLDEPTSSLDPILTYEVLEAINALVHSEKDVILVTHEIGFAKEIADYIIYMEEGKIIEHGNSDMFDQPKTQELKDFLSKVLSFT